jgi:Uma2 family endonuclease
MPTQTRLITAEEFLEWPDEPGCRQELIRGEVVTAPLHGAQPGAVAAEVGCLLGNYIAAMRLGATYASGTGFVLERDPDTVRGPSMAFVRRERLAAIANPDEYVPFAPDLAVVVVSPNDPGDEVEEKVPMWLRAGTLMVWIVDPESRTVTIHRPGAEPVTLGEDQTILGGEVIPGFECRVSDFFSVCDDI